MQRRELDRATFEVASSMDISGWDTADEIDRSYRIGKGRSFWHIASLAFLGSLMAVGLLITVAPLPANADDDKDSRHGHEDNDKGIHAEIAALQAQVAALQDQVKTLQTTNTDQQKAINSLQTSNTALQKQVGDLQTSNATLQKQLAIVQSNHALLLGPFVNVDPNPEIGVIGPNIIFSGANIHIVSGSGRTDDHGNRTGLGNLIIGYNEDPTGIPGIPDFGHPPPGPPLGTGDRGGSHNLVIGRWNRFTQAAFGGFVGGELNVISNEGASVVSGSENTASGLVANVSGGQFNHASGALTNVSGGEDNSASGFATSVTGGLFGTASFFFDSVLGGQHNTAHGGSSVVLGGENNTAGGFESVVIGGTNITNNTGASIAPQPPFP